MKSLAQQLAEYEQQHQNKTNQLTHYIGIPAIVVGTLILLSWISIGFGATFHVTFAWMAIVLAIVYYYFLDMKLAIAMGIVLVIVNLFCTWIAYPHPTAFSLILFIVLFFGGWALQFIGHSTEKSKPAFIKNLMSFPIAPMYVFIKALRALKLDKHFEVLKQSHQSSQDHHQE